MYINGITFEVLLVDKHQIASSTKNSLVLLQIFQVFTSEVLRYVTGGVKFVDKPRKPRIVLPNGASLPDAEETPIRLLLKHGQQRLVKQAALYGIFYTGLDECCIY